MTRSEHARTARRQTLAVTLALSWVALLALVPTAVAAVSFAAPATFPVGHFPGALAVDDLDDDGDLDLVVANSDDDDVSVLLGDGSGGFGAATDFPAGDLPRAVATSDLNGDGALDLAVVNAVSRSVAVLLGDGTGAFGAATAFTIGATLIPHSLAVGDLDSDGDTDLMVGASTGGFGGGTGYVVALLGDGSGSFGAPNRFQVGHAPYNIVAGDLNGDGALDVVAVDGAGFGLEVWVLLGNGSGNFGFATPFAAGGSPWAIAIGDLNGDARLDLAVTGAESSNIGVLLGDGLGGFGEATFVGLGLVPSSVALGDLDADGNLDIVVSGGGSLDGGGIGVLLGDGSGGFGVPTRFRSAPGTNDGAYAHRLADLDGDGRLDFVAIRNDPAGGPGEVVVMRNTTGTGSEAPSVVVTTPAAGARFSLGQSVGADFACHDGGSGVVSCAADVDGTAIADGAAVPTDVAGMHTFTVTATDGAARSTTVANTFEVLAGSTSQAVSGGETVTTDPGGVGATTDVPLQTAIAVPDGTQGTLSVTLQQTSGGAPQGYSFYGREVVLSGPVASAAAPYEIAFTVDASLLGDVAPADLQVFRDETLVAGCRHATSAVPDPCVASRAIGPGGDALITVRTSAFSVWNLGSLSYAVSAFAAPVVAPPGSNTATAGSSIALRFSLGANRGLDVFAAGYPRSVGYACGGEPPDPAAGSSTAGTLSYDAARSTYTYTWKTAKAMRGCRQVALRFRDGSVRTGLWSLR